VPPSERERMFVLFGIVWLVLLAAMLAIGYEVITAKLRHR
jgi:hypothetical protein